MLITFSLSMLGFLLVHRKFTAILQEFAFPQHMIRAVYRLNTAVFGMLIPIFSTNLSTLWLVIGILLITLNFFPQILRFFLQRKLQQILISVLDMIILSLQGGKSLQLALKESFNCQQGWVKKQLFEILASIQNSDSTIQAKSAVLRHFREELNEIILSQTKSIEQVKALRRQLKMKEDFRRRSGQVSQQIKMQAIIVTALYVSLLIFVVHQFGFIPHHRIILMSVIVFIVGLFWIFNVGRNIKWKV
jgi:hypothetical protein